MGNVPHPESLITRLAAVERAVRELAKRGGLGNAVITRGGLEVQYDNGVSALRIGEFDLGGGNVVFGIATRRRDGTLATWQYSDQSNGGFWSVWDRVGNIILSDDAASGQGLATAWLPVPVYDDTNPTRTTVSGTFEALQQCLYAKQHPKFYARVRFRSSASDTTGEIRVTANAVAVGDIKAVAGSEAGYWEFGPWPVDGDHLGPVEFSFQARRTAGTGNIGIRVIGAYGVQS